MMLTHILAELSVSKVFFVDIGALHPTRYSNTYYFYRRGWHGINVDALQCTKRLFSCIRPRDITIEYGVGSQADILTYDTLNESALNTFSAAEAERKIGRLPIVETIPIPSTASGSGRIAGDRNGTVERPSCHETLTREWLSHAR